MQEKPLEIERVEDAAGSSVVFRLHGPLLLGNFFSFQSMVRNDQSPLLIVDLAAFEHKFPALRLPRSSGKP